MARKPSHLGSNKKAPAGRSSANLASMGSIGGRTAGAICWLERLPFRPAAVELFDCALRRVIEWSRRGQAYASSAGSLEFFGLCQKLLTFDFRFAVRQPPALI